MSKDLKTPEKISPENSNDPRYISMDCESVDPDSNIDIENIDIEAIYGPSAERAMARLYKTAEESYAQKTDAEKKEIDSLIESVANSININDFENRYPQIAEDIKAVQRAQYELIATKMLSYGTENITLGTNLDTPLQIKESLTGIWYRLTDKMNRLRNLVVRGNENSLEGSESILDTWMDMANYAMIAQVVSKGRWK